MKSFYPYFVILVYLFIVLVGCSMVEQEATMNVHPFPKHLIDQITLPDKSPLSQTQIAYCSYSNYVKGTGFHWEIKVMSLNGPAVFNVTSFAPSPSGDNLGCWGYPKIATTSLNWSPDGKQLLYESDLITTLRSYLIETGEQISATTFLNLPKYTSYHFPRLTAWSPNGDLIAFVGSGTGSNLTFPSIFVATADGHTVKQLTNEPTLPGGGSSLTWSHDSSYLAYILPEPDNGVGIIDVTNGSVLKFNPDTISDFLKQPPELTTDLSENNLDWFPGDNLLAVVAKGTSPQHDLLWAITPSGSEHWLLYEGNMKGFTLKPDGSELVVVEVGDKNNYLLTRLILEDEVQVEPLLDTTIWEKVTIEYPVVRDPQWSSDGKRLIFASNPTGNYDIFVWDWDSKEIIQLTDNPVDEVAPHWRPEQKGIK